MTNADESSSPIGLTEDQLAQIDAACQAKGLEPASRELLSEMLMYWSFEEILEYFSR